MKRIFQLTFRWLFVVSVLAPLHEVSAQDLNSKLPLDPQVKVGKLENGLTYYIRQNRKPEKKVELRLVVNAGAINEDDDQRGLAHMAEHMAFNGTKNFKKNEIISFLQDIGVGFGNDLNAYTSFDETVYILPIPTEKEENLAKGFQVLEDWAHNVTYLDEDIDGERAIILEESRLGKGANDRMLKQVFPKLFAGSKYAERLPIGVDSIIRNFKHDAIRRYYRDWYRPDLMAVIVVGDIDPKKAEDMVKKHFSTLVAPANPRERQYEKLPAYTASDAIVVADREATGYNIGFNYSAIKSEPSVTIKDYRDDLVQQMFTTLLNQRFQEITQKENPPFIFGFAGFDSYARGYEAFNVFAGTGTGDVKRGMDALVEEVEKVRRFGFTAGELDRAKKTMLNNYERNFNNRDKTESENYVQEYINHFLAQEPSPGIEKEFEYVKSLVPGIALEEVNAVTAKFKDDRNPLVFAMGPEPNAGASLPKGDELLAIFDAKQKADLKAYEDKAVASNLISKDVKPGKITSTKKNAQLGTTEITLSNGVKVTLKSTDFKNDQILMGATRQGGKNHYGLADKFNAEYATQVVSSMGVGEFSPTDLRKALAGKTVSVSPFFSAMSEGVRGSSSNKDVETMLQLTHLYFTAPRKDTGLFASFVQKNKSQFANLAANPQNAFIDTMYKTLFNNNPMAPVAVPSSAYFDKINLDRSLAIYKERFGDANGMDFVFVGSFKEDELLPLLEKYLGSLPATKKKFTMVDNKVRPVKGDKTLNISRGKEEKSLILAFYTGEIPYTEDLELKTQAVSEILNIRIIEELREKVQGIYGGGIYGGLEKYPYSNYTFVLQLPCGPEKVDTLLRAVNREFDLLVNEGPDQSYLDKVKQQWKEKHKTSIKENNTWLNQLLEYKFQGGDPARFLEYEKYVDALTIKDVQQAARVILKGQNKFTAVLMPENYGQQVKGSGTVGNRKVNIQQTIELGTPEFQVDLYDNGEVDGDIITVYFNGKVVAGKQTLTEKPITLKLKADPSMNNELVMFAENLGSIPPNTALMKVSAGGKTYEVRLESNTEQSGGVNFKLK